MKSKTVRRSLLQSQSNREKAPKIKLSKEDKRFYTIFLVMAVIVSAFYLYVGGKNPFIVPAMLCIALVFRNYRKQRRQSN